MIVRNKGNNTCYFPYAGANGVRGKNLATGECSDELPVTLLDNRFVKRHWESGYIDLLLNATEATIYAKQYKLVSAQEEDLRGKGYAIVCRPGTVKRPITQPTPASTPVQQMEIVPAKDRTTDPLTPNLNIPSMRKEGEEINLQRVLEDPTRSPLGSPIDDIPAVIKQAKRIPVEKYIPTDKPQVLSPNTDPSAITETQVVVGSTASVEQAVQEHADAPVEPPVVTAPGKRGRKSKKDVE